MDIRTYQIVSKQVYNPEDEFNRFLVEFENAPNVAIERHNAEHASVSLNNKMASLKMLSVNDMSTDSDEKRSLILSLEVSSSAGECFEIVRIGSSHQSFGWQIFDDEHACLVPSHPHLIPAAFVDITSEALTIFRDLGFHPSYLYRANGVWFATRDDGTVHIINPFLLEFIIVNDSLDEKSNPELSYQVANNLQEFGLLFQRGLIPVNFYEFYKRSHKIINNSQFNIKNPGRKVFVKPYIFELSNFDSPHYTMTSGDRNVLYIDKIRKGETLDKTLKRIVSTELEIAEDYAGAVVSPNIEFDRDKEGKLIPRLLVYVYIKDFKNPKNFKKKSETAWRPIER